MITGFAWILRIGLISFRFDLFFHVVSTISKYLFSHVITIFIILALLHNAIVIYIWSDKNASNRRIVNKNSASSNTAWHSSRNEGRRFIVLVNVFPGLIVILDFYYARALASPLSRNFQCIRSTVPAITSCYCMKAQL